MLKNSERGALMAAYIGKRPLTAPETLYFGVSTTQPLADGTGITEPTIGETTGYYRVPIVNIPTNWAEPIASNNYVVSNINKIEFPEVKVDCGTMNYYFISNVVTGGLALAGGQFNVPRPMPAYSTLYINAGDAKFSIIN